MSSIKTPMIDWKIHTLYMMMTRLVLDPVDTEIKQFIKLAGFKKSKIQLPN